MTFQSASSIICALLIFSVFLLFLSRMVGIRNGVRISVPAKKVLKKKDVTQKAVEVETNKHGVPVTRIASREGADGFAVCDPSGGVPTRKERILARKTHGNRLRDVLHCTSMMSLIVVLLWRKI